MDGLDAGTIVAVLKLVDEMSPALKQALASTDDFKESLEESYAPTTAFSSAMKQVASTTTEATVQQVALTSTVKSGATATTEAALAQTAFTVAAIESTDAGSLTKKMMAEMTAAAEANLPATSAVAATHTELAAVLAVATAAWEALAVPLGLVTIAVVAFGPRLWELAGGWDGVTAAVTEALSIFEDLGVILESIGGYVLNSVIEGVTATFQALATLGGAAVDAVKWFGDLLGVWDVIGSTYGAVRDGIHAIAGAISEANAELAKVPTGFQGATLSFGIDPNDAQEVAKVTAELDKLVAASIKTNTEAAALEGTISTKLTPAMAAQLGITLSTTDSTDKLGTAQVKLKDASKMTFDELLRWGGSAVITGGIEDVTLASKDLTYQLLQMGGGMSIVVAPGIESMNASFTAGGSAIASVIPSTNLLTSSLMGLPVKAVTQDVSQVVYAMKTWDETILDIAQSFLLLGSVIPGVTGGVLSFVGLALQGFLTLRSSFDSIISGFHQLQTSFSSGFSLSSFSGVLSGMTSIIGAVGSAITLFGALGSAIKRAFTSEETEVVSPNRNIFFEQFLGEESDPFTALGNAMNRAAMQVYGVSAEDSWPLYGQPLMQALYDADTWEEFKAAELAIGELFKKAGIAINIIDEQGSPTPYRSNVFDTGYSGYDFGITPTTDLAALQTQFTTGAQGAVLNSYNTGSTAGGTYFQSGSMGSMSSSGLCIHVENLYVGGATGDAQARSFFDSLFQLVSNGGQPLTDFRNLVCAAQA